MYTLYSVFAPLSPQLGLEAMAATASAVCWDCRLPACPKPRQQLLVQHLRVVVLGTVADALQQHKLHGESTNEGTVQNESAL